MSLFGKRKVQPPRQATLGLLEDAIGRAEAVPSFADECEHVRTAHGRTVHLKHPELGVLCPFGAAAEVQVDPFPPSLPVCRMCADAAKAIEELRTAS